MISRRRFLHAGAAGGGLVALGGGSWSWHPGAPQATPRRRSLGEMDLDDPDLQTFRELVRILQDPSRNGDPVSWVGFANVHGDFSGFNLCPHGNWYFTPWHRGYLRMYERAARDLTGNPDFALPYWDWTVDRQLPRAFTEETFDGRPNPLFLSDRWMGPDDSLPDDIVGAQEVMDGIYGETIFEAFGSSRPVGQTDLDADWIQRRGVSGPLEATPHDNVHIIVGAPFMATGASPRDPIFLAHHCNIDRIWAVWNSLGRVNTTDPLWLEMPFEEHFIAPDGARYTDIVRDLQEVEPLGYTYGLVDEAPLPETAGRSLFFRSLFGAPEILEGAGIAPLAATPSMPAEALRPLSIPISPDPAALLRSVERAPATVEATGLRLPQVYAILRDIDPERPDGTQLRVFVNCDYLAQSVPSADPHYVTTIGFFGASAHGGHGRSALVNLTPALRRLGRGQRLDAEHVVVQLLPAPQPGRSLEDVGPVAVGRVELVIA